MSCCAHYKHARTFTRVWCVCVRNFFGRATCDCNFTHFLWRNEWPEIAIFIVIFYDFLRFLIGLFIHFWISGEWEKAIPIFTEAIEINATSAMPFVKRGQCFMKLSKPNACIRDCTRAIEINPDNAAAHKYRGRAHR